MVRLCLLKKKQMNRLLREQDLTLDELDDLDFSSINATQFKFKPKCYRCPEAEKIRKVNGNVL